MKLSRLCSALDGLEGGSTTGRQKGVRVFDFQERDIIGIAYDSRKVRPGYLFVAVPGSKADGHTFLREAVERGAVALVTEKPATANLQDALPVPGGLTRIVVPSSRKAQIGRA